MGDVTLTRNNPPRHKLLHFITPSLLLEYGILYRWPIRRSNDCSIMSASKPVNLSVNYYK